MTSITSVGVGSGIDLEALVDQIVEAERGPTENRLELQQTRIEAEISAIGSLQLTLNAFRDSLNNLKDGSFFANRTAVSSDTKQFTATADSGAQLGTYDVQVTQLAEANKIASDRSYNGPNTTIGAGQLTIALGSGQNFSLDITATDTLLDIRNKINNDAANVGVTASLINVDAGLDSGTTRFVLTANNTGTNSEISITVDDDDGNDTDATGLSQFNYSQGGASNQFTELNRAQDAKITVDGFTITNSSNTFSNVIEDVTITALEAVTIDILNPAPPERLIISEERAGTTAAVETFVASYNELITVFNTLTDYDPVSGTSGLLSGDSVINSIESSLRRVLGDTVNGAKDGLNALTFIGISTNSNGSLRVDSAKVSELVSSNLEDIAELFSGSDGIATRLDETLELVLRSGGTFTTRDETLQTGLRDIQEQRDNLDLRVSIIEERFRSQFAGLDILVARLNSTGNFLTQQLSAAAAIVNRDNGG